MHGLRLMWSRFSAGAWSAATPLASDLIVSSQLGAPSQLAALPDGRVALVYLTTKNTLSGGFYDGTAWSTFRTVPGTMTRRRGLCQSRLR